RGVFYRKKKRSLWGGEGRRESPLDRTDKVMGRDGIAIGPARVRTEMKGVGASVGGDGPLFGDGGQRRASLGRGRDQTFAQRADDKEFIRERCEMRIERGGFIPLADAEGFFGTMGGRAFGTA